MPFPPGPPRPAPPPPVLVDDERGVTPVIGAILILAITVLGASAILAWGAPTIQRIQDQNAQMAMTGEMEGLRLATQALSVPDAARTPTVVMADGVFGLREGTRMMITGVHDVDHAECAFHVTGWHGSPTDRVNVDAANCREPVLSCPPADPAIQACFEVHSVVGNNLVQRTVNGGPTEFTVPGHDLTQGNWVFRLTSGDPNNFQVYAQAWLIRNDQHYWELASPVGERGVYLEGGALFSRSGVRIFQESPLPLQEDAYGTGDYVLWVRSVSATQQDAQVGRGSNTVFLGLVGSYSRIRSDDATMVRYDFHGGLSEAWCNALLGRNEHLQGSPYDHGSGTLCTDPVPSVVYSTGSSFPFEYIHAQIRSSIQT